MIFNTELFEGCKLITQNIYRDNRGYFTETYNQKRYEKDLGNIVFVQDNESCSSKFVMRGLHFQKGEHAQAKLVRVIKGQVIDFVLDIRHESKTYGKMLFVPLTQGVQFFIPRGMAHGFIALDDQTIFAYKCDNFWNKEAEGGYNILDQKLNIVNKLLPWIREVTIYKNLNEKDLIFSDKDLKYPNFFKN